MNRVSTRSDVLQIPAKAMQPAGKDPGKPQGAFGDMLKQAVTEISQLQNNADKAITSVQLGQSGNIHEAMIALEKADISFRATMQVRNKILEAYQEVMRMQV
ncbi:MAG: flagellar hook-basal body complex protein FliE [Desulfobacterales bacterium]|nr:flagellar hook-basal body complex protein FliE [Desulfobacterales bacterium]